jgi:hypothetical protein
MPPPLPLLVNLRLLCPDKRSLVDVRVYFDIAIIGQLEGVLRSWLVDHVSERKTRRATEDYLPTCCS